MAEIAVPTAGGISNAMRNYGMGFVAGIGYRLVSRIAGSSLIGGAVTSAVVSATVKGPVGEYIAVSTGFQAGTQMNIADNLVPSGLSNLFGNLGGGQQQAQIRATSVAII